MSATTAYMEAGGKVATKMARLQVLLSEHSRRQSKDPKNWGLVGDLNRINSHLDDLLEGFEGFKS